MRQLQDIFTHGGISSPPRWERCVAVSLNYFGAKVSQLFYRRDREESEAARQAALKMFGDLRNAFGELIDEAEWMDQETRNYAKEKLAAVTPIVGFKDDEDGWLTEEFMKKIYSGMGDVTTDDYFENVLNAMRFWTKRGFSRVDKTPPAFMTMKSKGFDST